MTEERSEENIANLYPTFGMGSVLKFDYCRNRHSLSVAQDGTIKALTQTLLVLVICKFSDITNAPSANNSLRR